MKLRTAQAILLTFGSALLSAYLPLFAEDPLISETGDYVFPGDALTGVHSFSENSSAVYVGGNVTGGSLSVLAGLTTENAPVIYLANDNSGSITLGSTLFGVAAIKANNSGGIYIGGENDGAITLHNGSTIKVGLEGIFIGRNIPVNHLVGNTNDITIGDSYVKNSASNASIHSGGTAIKLGDSVSVADGWDNYFVNNEAEITNNGDLTSDDGDGIYLFGENEGIITNNGSISAENGDGIYVKSNGSEINRGAEILNSGTITASVLSGNGIYVNNGNYGTVSNDSSGSISGDCGIFVGSNKETASTHGVITNSGTINATNVGIHVGENEGKIDVSGKVTVTGNDGHAIWLDKGNTGYVHISSAVKSGGDVIYLGDALGDNAGNITVGAGGSITSTTGNGICVTGNNGGDAADWLTMPQGIYNYGVIKSNGSSIYVGGNNTTDITNFDNGTYESDGTLTSLTGNGIEVAGVNTGNIGIYSGEIIAPMGSGILVGANGTKDNTSALIRNYGTIGSSTENVLYGIRVENGNDSLIYNINNIGVGTESGHIYSTNAAIFVGAGNSGTILNLGTLNSSAGNGIEVVGDNIGTIENRNGSYDEEIIAAKSGISVGGSNKATDASTYATITNSATITAKGVGIQVSGINEGEINVSGDITVDSSDDAGIGVWIANGNTGYLRVSSDIATDGDGILVGIPDSYTTYNNAGNITVEAGGSITSTTGNGICVTGENGGTAADWLADASIAQGIYNKGAITSKGSSIYVVGDNTKNIKNNGTLNSSEGNGIEVAGTNLYSIYNYGAIVASGGSGILVGSNGFGSASLLYSIDNYGTIGGSAGDVLYGIRVKNDNNGYIINDNGTIGDADHFVGVDGIHIGGSIQTGGAQSAGSIYATDNGVQVVGGITTSGAYLRLGNSMNNSGVVVSDNTAVLVGDVDNAGAVTGEANNAGWIRNYGTINSRQGNGIQVTGTNSGTIRNDYSILAPHGDGISVGTNGSADNTTAGIVNEGTIVAGENGISVFGNNYGEIDHSGSLGKSDAYIGGAGIKVGGDNSGIIRFLTASNTYSVGDALWVVGANTGTIRNIESIQSSHGNGLHVSEANTNTIQNMGQIIASNGSGILVGSNGTVSDFSSATITNLETIGSSSGDVIYGIRVVTDNYGTITNDNGATINAERGIYVAGDNGTESVPGSVTENVGTIGDASGTYDMISGIEVGSSNYGTLLNSGTMEIHTTGQGVTFGIIAQKNESTGTIRNTGTINSEVGLAVTYYNDGMVLNGTGNDANEITAKTGLSVADNLGTVSNLANAIINASQYGIYVGDNEADGSRYGTISNYGTIASSGDGIHMAGNNAGYIDVEAAIGSSTTSVGDNAIQVVGGNSGSIDVYGSSADLYSTNDAILIGDTTEGAVAANNSGEILTEDMTIYSSAGNGIHITGDNAGTASQWVLDDGGSSATISVGDINAHLNGILIDGNNAGTIEVNGTLSVNFTGDGIRVGSNSGAITNNGTIQCYSYSIHVLGDNTGSITNASTGNLSSSIYVDSNSHEIINNGIIAAYTHDGIFIWEDSGAITNTGTITGRRGIYAHRVTDLIYNNSGTITADAAKDYSAIVASYGNSTGEIRNSGTLNGANGIASFYGNTAFVNNTETGTINADKSGISFGQGSGSITNAGTINADDYGIYVTQNVAGSINNSGTIKALTSGASLTNGIYVGGNVSGSIINTGSIISSGSAIYVGGSVGVETDAEGNKTAVGSVMNYGDITVTDEGVAAIDIIGDVGSIMISGNIHTNGGDAFHVGGEILSMDFVGDIDVDANGLVFDSDLDGSMSYKGDMTTSGHGIYFDADVLADGSITVKADTTITAGDTTYLPEDSIGVYVAGNNAGTITNSGYITANEAGICVGSNSGSIVNNYGASIINNTDGIKSDGDSNNITNNGSISATYSGIHVASNSGSIVNAEGSTIVSTNYGIKSDGDSDTITNSGSITTTISDAIYVDGNAKSITSTGSLESEDSRAINVTGNVGTMTLSGTITGKDRDVYVSGNVGILNTSADISLSASYVYAIQILGDLTGELTNSGHIYSTGGAVYSSGIRVGNNSGTITNSGRLDDLSNGIYIYDKNFGSIVNSKDGVIDVSSDGIRVDWDSNKITNAGTIVAGRNGIYVSGDANEINNSGSIQADLNGIYVDGDVIDSMNTSGDITSAREAVYITGNTGTFSSTGVVSVTPVDGDTESYDAIHFGGDVASITLGGTITGTKNGVYVAGDVTGNLVSDADITAKAGNGIRVEGSVGGNVTNTGDITSTAEAIYIGGNVGDLVSTGDLTISNSDTYAVYVGGDANSITVDGNISADNDAFYVAGTIKTLDVDGDIETDQTGLNLNEGVDDNLSYTGSMHAGSYGIDVNASNSGNITIEEGSDITSQEASLNVNGSNSGVIASNGSVTSNGSSGIAVNGENTGSISNGGVMTAATSGISVAGDSSGSISNTGTITSTESGILVEGNAGSIVSTGSVTVTGENMDAIHVAGNASSFTLGGIVAGTQNGVYIGGSISNDFISSADITADGSGILIGGSNNGSLHVLADSSLKTNGVSILVRGDNTSMESIDNAGKIVSANSNGIEVNGDNTGAIRNTSTGSVDAAQYGILVLGNNTEGALIDNSGSIVSGTSGIYVVNENAGSIVNSSIITSDTYAIQAGNNTGSISNSGTLSGGEDGIIAFDNGDSDGSITNSGTINAGSVGIYALMDTTNSGIINATTGVIIYDASFVNTGTITATSTGEGSAGVGLNLGGKVTAILGGTITSDSDAIIASSGNNVVYLTEGVEITGSIASRTDSFDDWLIFGVDSEDQTKLSDDFNMTYTGSATGFYADFMAGTTTLDSAVDGNNFNASTINASATLVVNDHTTFAADTSLTQVYENVPDNTALMNLGTLSGAGKISLRLEDGSLGGIYSSGTLSPNGSSIGSITIDGDLTIAGDVLFDVSTTTSDIIYVTSDVEGESASVNITSDAVFNFNVEGMPTFGTVYTILEVEDGSVSVEEPVDENHLVNVETNLNDNYDFYVLSDDPGSIYVIVSRAYNYFDVANTQNQKSIATYLDANVTIDEAQNLLFNLNLITDDSSLRNELTLLSGEIYPSVASAVDELVETMSENVVSMLRPYSTEENQGHGWYAFGNASVSSTDTEDDQVADLSIKTDLLTVGVGYRYNEVLDFGGWITSGEQAITDNHPDRVETDVYSGGLYARYNKAGDYYYASVVYGKNENDVTRLASLPIQTHLSEMDGYVAGSEFDTDYMSLYLEKGYTFDLGKHQLQPYVGWRYTQIQLDDVAEKGDSVFDLRGEFADVYSSVATLGFNWQYDLQRYGLSLVAGVAWNHQFGDAQGSMRASLGDLDTHYRVYGQDHAEDAFSANFGINWAVSNKWLMHLRAVGTESDSVETISGNIGVTYLW
jgi:uncharacterized protein YhjY with autotransporter beta-barrel domain